MEELASMLTVDTDASVWVDTKGSTVNKVEITFESLHILTTLGRVVLWREAINLDCFK